MKKQPKKARLRVTTFRVTFDQLDQMKREAREARISMSALIRQRLDFAPVSRP